MKTMRILGACLVLVALVSVGCAPKTESEKLQDEMKKAQKQLQREADAWK